MRIRKSNETDFKRIMEIYEYARGFMAKTGNPNQWGPTNWPPEALIHDDISNGNSYVCTNEDGRVLGTFFFEYGQDIEPTYRDINDGEWSQNEAYGVVHRIASDGSVKGIGQYCLDWAYEQAGNLRIDTHPDNVVMQKLLEKLGFKKCGIIHVLEDNYPRYAYEKI
ncbi:MAG: GNAT family N-acetyltransferase [Oribacterium sp.]|nr:GNAT family N-acetyltransferase [Oribacterium sp.]